jgi:hypothetical protein
LKSKKRMIEKVFSTFPDDLRSSTDLAALSISHGGGDVPRRIILRD